MPGNKGGWQFTIFLSPTRLFTDPPAIFLICTTLLHQLTNERHIYIYKPKPSNFGKAREHIVTGLGNCISKWCNKKGLPIDILKDWKHAVLEKVDNRIKSLSFNLKYHKVNVSLSNKEVKSCLSELQSKYIIYL